MEDFIGVTISDLSDKYLPLTIKSINSFLKFHDTKLVVYIVGDKELPIQDNRIEIIRIPYIDYSNHSSNITKTLYRNQINVLIPKLMCLTKQKNFIFFENDVFFFKNMRDIWDNMYDGTGFVPVTRSLMNSGLIIVKNTDIINYTVNDIIKYYTENIVPHPCDDFLTLWCSKQIRQLSDEACIVALSISYSKKIHMLSSCHSVHCVYGKEFITNSEHRKKAPEFISELIKKMN